MQLNSTSTSSSDLNADMIAYIFARDTERRLEEGLKNSIDDIKEVIKDSTLRTQESFKSMKNDMTKMEENTERKFTKMEEKITKMEENTERKFTKMEENTDEKFTKMNGKIDEISKDMTNMKMFVSNANVAVVVGFILLASIQPDLRSLISIILKFVNV